ncbi:MAG: DUF1018 domain-containing protein [Chitinispirillaceae bacterium]|nr:DUF1018 domain-containing protein [Chitinispirillaceae bacterium]
MSTGAQIKKIHVLKSDLHLADKDYRSLLAAYRRLSDGPVGSSKELSIQQASAVIKTLEHLIDATPEVRSRVYAGDRQISMLFALWRLITVARESEGIRKTLQSFLERHFHVRDIDHLPKGKVPKIVSALKAIVRQQERAGSDV